jgi:hypothetical protein
MHWPSTSFSHLNLITGCLVRGHEVQFTSIDQCNSARYLSSLLEKTGKMKRATDLCNQLREVFANVGSTDEN